MYISFNDGINNSKAKFGVVISNGQVICKTEHVDTQYRSELFRILERIVTLKTIFSQYNSNDIIDDIQTPLKQILLYDLIIEHREI